MRSYCSYLITTLAGSGFVDQGAGFEECPQQGLVRA